MSNFDLINLNNAPAHAAMQMDLDTGAQTVPKISTAGGLFTIKIDKIANQKPTTDLEVIIIGQYNKGAETQRAYYAGTYSPGSTDRPTCSSDNGIAPRSDVENPQFNNCKECPRNIAPKGQRRDCSFYTTLAVVLPGGDTPLQLRVPATSTFGVKEASEDFFSLNAYKAWFASREAQPFQAVTKLVFARGTQKGFSFVPVRATTEDEIALAVEATNSPIYNAIIQAGATKQLSAEPHDPVSAPAKKIAAPVEAEEPTKAAPTKAAPQNDSDAVAPSRSKSLADALGGLDD